jgi:mono/diheme cytochrome c family protein
MRRALVWIRNGLLALVGLVVLLIGSIYVVSELRMRRSFTVDAAPIAVPQSAAAIAEGQRLVVARGCTDCHGENLAGTKVLDDPLIGRLYGANLTKGRGGVGGEYTPATFARAIRHGVAADGRALLFMPSHEYAGMSDTDTGAIIAYLTSVQPVDRENPSISAGPLLRAVYLAGQVALVPAEKIDHAAKPAAPIVGVSVEYGRYLAAGCTGCHGLGYSGGPIPGAPPSFPPAANLTPDNATGLGAWSEADFMRALREGVRPDGSSINPVMPWKNLARMSDTELRALYMFLRQVPAQPRGNR